MQERTYASQQDEALRQIGTSTTPVDMTAEVAAVLLLDTVADQLAADDPDERMTEIDRRTEITCAALDAHPGDIHQRLAIQSAAFRAAPTVGRRTRGEYSEVLRLPADPRTRRRIMKLRGI